MLVTLQDNIGKEVCSIVIPPLSKVQLLLKMIIKEMHNKNDWTVNTIYIRPTFWEQYAGLHPDTTLPLVINRYIVDTRSMSTNLVEYDPEQPHTPVLSCHLYRITSEWSILLWVILVMLFLKIYHYYCYT